MSDEARIAEFEQMSDKYKLIEFKKRVKEVRRYRTFLKRKLEEVRGPGGQGGCRGMGYGHYTAKEINDVLNGKE